MKRILFVFMSLLLLVGLNSFFTSVTHAETDYDQEELAYSKKFREEFGLDKAENRIIQILKDKNNPKIKKYLGTFLTESEQASLENRLNKLHDITPKIKEHIIKKFGKQKFGGLLIKQDEDGKIYIGIKSKFGKSDLAELVSQYQYQNIELFPVNFSEDELNNAINILTDQIDTLAKKGVKINFITADLQKNNLQIGIQDINSDTTSLIQSLVNIPFEIKQSEAGTKTATAPTRKNYLRPVQSGLQITPQDNKLSWCTSGFTGYDNTSSGTVYYTLTAGHCGNKGRTFLQGSSVFGSIEKDYENGNVDAAGIRISADDKTHYVYGTSSNSYEITGWQKVSPQDHLGQVTYEDNYGDDVCFAGATTNQQVCGVIMSTNYTVSYDDGTTFRGMRLATMGCQGGDSGSGVYQHGKAMGILQGHNQFNQMVYSYMGNVVNSLGLDGILVK